MNNPGPYTLAALQITTALTSSAQTAILDLEGMIGCNIEATLGYGSGGATVIAVIQTTLDGNNWRDIARFDFATATVTKHVNLSGILSKGVTEYAVLGAQGVYDAVFGKWLRCVITSTGTYVGTTLTVTASAR